MKTIFLFTAFAAAISLSAVTPDVVSETTTTSIIGSNQLDLGNLNVTNAAGETISAADIQEQLSELRREIEEIKPVLNAVAESYSNSASAQPSVTGGIANVLGGILSRNTNNVSGNAGSTNALGRVLQGVLGTASTNSGSASAEIRDLMALQQHLDAATPILQRLATSPNISAPSAVGGTADDQGDDDSYDNSDSDQEQETNDYNKEP